MASFDVGAILAMDLDLDEEKLKPIKAYPLSAERLAIYVGVVGAITPGCTTIAAVVCETTSGETIETLVDTSNGEHLKLEDPIMYTEIAIPSLVEAQFIEGGDWVLSRGTAEGVEAEKSILFGKYADAITELPPSCLATLRRLLQAGPITTVFSGGGKPPHVNSHEGFALRMPAAEVGDWTLTNDKGEVVDVLRPAKALRVWDASAGGYASIDPSLAGAPDSPEGVHEWFVGVVRTLKASDYIGPALLDRLATSERTVATEPELEVAGNYANQWTDLVLATHA